MTGPDLAEQADTFMADRYSDDSLSGFTVHRNTADGTAAVTFRPGLVDALPGVLRQTLHPWATGLRKAGFAVDIEYSRTDPTVPVVLHITGRTPQKAATP
jgi:hypothetical protein